MDILSKTDTTTFVLVTLLLFVCYNIALICWFRFFVKDSTESSRKRDLNEKFSEDAGVKEMTEDSDDLPF